jgi:hypothetical protein
MSNRDKILDKVTDRLRELTINELFEANGNATGTLVNSIKYIPITQEEGNTQIALEMEEYGFILDSGRGGATRIGNRSWQPQLIQWIRAKSIRPRTGQTIEQLSYAIYNSINRKGYRAKPFVENALAAYDAVFANEYAEATAADIEIDLKKIKGNK